MGVVALRLKIAPVRDDVRALAVDLEPGERFFNHRSVQQPASMELGARSSADGGPVPWPAAEWLQACENVGKPHHNLASSSQSREAHCISGSAG